MSAILTVSEKEREDKVRTLPCPNCAAKAKHPCTYGLSSAGARITIPTSHTGRYVAAQEAGLVPPWRGWPWMT
jgi:hypothetical protein